MRRDQPKAKRRLNADEKRALAAETMRRFAETYARKAQRGVEPNDRAYSRDVEKAMRRMAPGALDSLLNDED